MTFECGYCLRIHKGGGRRAKGDRGCKADKLPYGTFLTWDDLIDHLINRHRFHVVDNKLTR